MNQTTKDIEAEYTTRDHERMIATLNLLTDAIDELKLTPNYLHISHTGEVHTDLVTFRKVLHEQTVQLVDMGGEYWVANGDRYGINWVCDHYMRVAMRQREQTKTAVVR